MTLLSEIYDVTLKRGIRGMAKGGLLRPTLGELFVTNKDYVEQPKHRLIPTKMDSSKRYTAVYMDDDRTVTFPTVRQTCGSIFGAASGKYYWEVTAVHTADWQCSAIGITRNKALWNVRPDGAMTGAVHRSSNDVWKDAGLYYNSLCPDIMNTGIYVIGIKLNLDDFLITFYTNGVMDVGPINIYNLGLTGDIYASIGATNHASSNCIIYANFGQSSFVYQVPEGYLPGFGQVL